MENKINYCYNKDDQYLLVEVIGDTPADGNDIDDYYKLISQNINRYNTNKVLFNYRKMIYKSSVLEMTNGFERFNKFNLNDKSLYFAAVLDFESELYEKYKLFLADIGVKKFLNKVKFNYSIFNNLSEAILWLRDK